jgi:fused signal recognition particle receptor
MFSFFKKPPAPPAAATPVLPSAPADAALPKVAESDAAAPPGQGDRQGWMARLRQGLRKTGSSIAQVFTGAQIGDEQYDELESALLMADAGLAATSHLLRELKVRVKAAGRNDAATVRQLLEDVLTELLAPLQRRLEIGRADCTVMMVVGVNGAGKTTSIGKLARHLADAGQKVLLAAADTFRAAAREQLAAWARRVDERGGPAAASAAGHETAAVEIVSQQGGDPAAVTYDAVVAARARGCDVVIADTAGRLTTQAHLMEELKKIKRVIGKADPQAPHEVLLVVDGNTGQNALAQVKAFDDALQLTGLIVTKLDGTAKGGVLAAIALWAHEQRSARPERPPLAVYFLGVGEKLEDLQTFSAREFAQALLG